MRRLLVAILILATPGIVAAQDSVRLRIEVRSEDGPVADADVVVNGRTQKTDAQGVTIFALAPGHAEIAVVKNGFAPASASLDLAPGREQPVTIELTRMPSVEEHVTVSATRTDRGIEDQPMRVEVVDPDSLVRCRPDQVGEIWVSGGSVAQGYWNRPLETAQTFGARLADTHEGPFLRTGDLGVLRDGRLFVTGRLKDLIIVQGRNHYPQDIERTVERVHAALRAGCGAAFSLEVDGAERLVVAQEIERHARDVNMGELTAAIRQAVAEEHDLQVDAIVLLKAGGLPKTSSGKIQRRACRDLILAGSADVVGEWRLSVLRAA